MRTITDHIVEGDSANHQLTITVTDEPCHRYEITGIDYQSNTSAKDTDFPDGNFAPVTLALFQKGPIKEFGVNGITHECLLSIVIDRLRSFQDGPFKCRENAIALTHCEDALMWLQRRARARIARGVEGTHQK